MERRRRSLDPDDGDVGGRVGPDDLRGVRSTPTEPHADVVRALHDVVVRDDVALAVDDEARAERADLLRPARGEEGGWHDLGDGVLDLDHGRRVRAVDRLGRERRDGVHSARRLRSDRCHSQDARARAPAVDGDADRRAADPADEGCGEDDGECASHDVLLRCRNGSSRASSLRVRGERIARPGYRLAGVAWVGGRAVPRLSRRPFGRWVVPRGSAMLAPAMVAPGPGEVEPG